MRTSLVILSLAAVAGPVLAQTRPPALMVRDEAAGRSQPLGLTKVAVQSRIFGFLAETRMTMTFTNPHDRQLEGELYFPLPEGATVSGYALDVQGRMIDGVVVGKQKARVVFEKEVRKGVDPGLVEWVKGNNFRTRVYPIPPRGSRTVAVEYVTDLTYRGADAVYRLPLGFKGKLQDFSLRVDVIQAGKKPRATWSGPGKLSFKSQRQGFFSEVEVHDRVLTGQLEVVLPAAIEHNVQVEEDPRGTVHFCVTDFPKDPEASKRSNAVRAPRRITVLWDASGSRGAQDHKRELDLLVAYLGRWTKSTVDVDLVLFRNAAQTARRFTVRNGDAHKLLDALRAVTYDGGTQMGAISPRSGRGTPDLYLLFSDGLSNFGKEEPTGFRAPVYAFSEAPDTNHPLLRHVSRSTGGEYFNLNALKDAQVLDRIGAAGFALLSAEFSGGEVQESFPRSGTPVHGRLTLSGKLLGKQATLRLKYGVGDRVLHESSHTISRKNAVPGDLVARYWAQQKVQALLVSPKRNEQALVALGKRYNLVTPGTSLMVLERIEQYLEHEIAPPKSWKELYVQYHRVMDERAANKKQEERSKLESILAMWKARVQWWETRFKYPKNFRFHEESDKKEMATGGRAPSSPRMRDAAPEAEESLAREAPASMDERRPAPAKSAKKKDSGGSGRAAPEPAIALAPWNPQTPYIAALKKARASKRFVVYLEQKKAHGNSPAFFLDCSDFFARKKDSVLALQVLSNIAELELENAALVRILAHRLAQIDRLELSAMLFEEVLRLRPEEPQSYRDLGLVLAQLKRYERAMELLAHVVMNRWDRFSEIELIALMELNRIIPLARKAGVNSIPIDKRLIKKLDLDIRLVLSWDADLTDIDLWVIEPSGEKAYYGHNRTTIGGLVSRDFTQGYGPEEYLLRRAMRGTYKVQTNFFGSSQQTLTGAVTLQLELITNYGRKNEKRKTITLRLTDKKETFTVGELEF